jgi:hypothetical protein
MEFWAGWRGPVLERLTKGKQAELYVFGELLRRGVVPYVPMVDIEGVDALIRSTSGYLELQVKSSATPKSPRWFQVERLRPRENYFLVCVNLTTDPPETWIMPSGVFAEKATQSKDIWDLVMDATPRGAHITRAEASQHYREAWHLLAGGGKSHV